MSNCYNILKEKGFNLEGYNIDTIYILQQSKGNFNECEALFWYLERVYG